MNPLMNGDQLQLAIKQLEQRINIQEVQMKQNLTEIKENLKPANLVKNSFSRLAETPEIQRTLMNTIVGFALGYAAKKAADVLSEQSLDRLVHNVVDTGLNKLERGQRHNLIGKTISLLRKNTPTHSALYPYVRYKHST